MSKAASFAAPAPDIATKAELDHLTQNRPMPASESHLTPDGPEAAAVQERVSAMERSRTSELQERLQRVREGFECDYALAGRQGRAKADFERSRSRGE